jgi:hypothetical protein
VENVQAAVGAVEDVINQISFGNSFLSWHNKAL